MYQTKVKYLWNSYRHQSKILATNSYSDVATILWSHDLTITIFNYDVIFNNFMFLHM